MGDECCISEDELEFQEERKSAMEKFSLLILVWWTPRRTGDSVQLEGRLYKGTKSSIGFVHRALKFYWQWQAFLDLEVIPLEDNVYLLKFGCEDDLRRALADGPWVVGGQVLFLREWEPSRCATDEKFGEMPVWVRLPSFPLCLWNRRNLITGSLATPLCLDHVTHHKLKLHYARIRISIDLDAPLPKGSWLNFGDFGSHHFEHVPSPCTSCGRIGHEASSCGVGKGPLEDQMLVEQATGDEIVTPEGVINSIEEPSEGRAGLPQEPPPSSRSR